MLRPFYWPSFKKFGDGRCNNVRAPWREASTIATRKIISAQSLVRNKEWISLYQPMKNSMVNTEKDGPLADEASERKEKALKKCETNRIAIVKKGKVM
ncbi:unnamed protein product [Bursaphelenchus xylophilus]|uniref:(pine wood nematode) hypothetical protein n=1 Tax=Bursaphelenchus xylophilus TaxID=6326 RepID=A0A7I8X6M5_BURXY|nr:unnamed protein product [Bursaphelenchus xylophilus]CAG9123372.1 unnamed protein product [Bursaphelenchus xylophilus]